MERRSNLYFLKTKLDEEIIGDILFNFGICEICKVIHGWELVDSLYFDND